MAAKLHSLRLLSALLIAVSAEPSPGRVPKVYNALITSNQNLEPSKAYPVYQPVLHDAVFSIQPSVLYGGHFPFGNGIIPIPAQPPHNAPPQNDAQPSQPPPPAASPSESASTESSTTQEPAAEEPSDAAPENPEPASGSSTTAAPPPPNTESPIPLNEFGLPPQVLPLGRIDPAYNGFNQLSPFTYSYPSYSPYPGVRLYDPFDPFSLGPYGFPLYRPLPNVLGPSVPLPLVPARLSVPVPAEIPTPAPAGQSPQTPPPEPSDLNLLNYSSKDPAIPNVPPPPLPQGGLKSDKSE